MSLSTCCSFLKMRCFLLPLGLLLLVSIVASEDTDDDSVVKTFLPEVPLASQVDEQEVYAGEFEDRVQVPPSVVKSVVSLTSEVVEALTTVRSKMEPNGPFSYVDPFHVDNVTYQVDKEGMFQRARVDIIKLDLTGVSKFVMPDVQAYLVGDKRLHLHIPIHFPNSIDMYTAYYADYTFIMNLLPSLRGNGEYKVHLKGFLPTIDAIIDIDHGRFHVAKIGAEIDSKEASIEGKNPPMFGIKRPISATIDFMTPASQMILYFFHSAIQDIKSRTLEAFRVDINEDLKNMTGTEVLTILKKKLGVRLPTLEALFENHPEAAAYNTKDTTTLGVNVETSTAKAPLATSNTVPKLPEGETTGAKKSGSGSLTESDAVSAEGRVSNKETIESPTADQTPGSHPTANKQADGEAKDNKKDTAPSLSYFFEKLGSGPLTAGK